VGGLRNPRDGHDTATHEFAHVLDRGDGRFDGTPELRASADYAPWAEVMSHHFLELRERSPRQRRVLRDYGATNEAEFFAVATETFFEKGRQLRERAPDLYEELRRFYRCDPANRPDQGK
jgi:Mlc titration factor MtfA (ptsG expression regulator)